MQNIECAAQYKVQDKLTSRIVSIDALRGIIAVIMALDHMRSTIHSFPYSPTDLTHTTFLIFMTRWITHFCAPVFIFLAGVSIFLSEQRGRTKKEMVKYLISRGIILILLDVVFVSRFITSSLTDIDLGVLWAIGVSMIIFSGLIWLSKKYIFVFGVIIVVAHNLLNGINISRSSNFHFIWSIFHSPDIFNLPYGIDIQVTYCLIPWVGVMALGYVFGQLMVLEQTKRSKILIYIGLGITCSFFVLRGLNLYGDPTPWTLQKNSLFTILSFINCEKYPASLLYLFMTLGPSILILGLLDKKLPRVLQPVLVFGREPLRFYLLHMLMIGVFIGLNIMIVLILNGGHAPKSDFIHHGLMGVYLGWIFIVVSLYPLFKRGFKKKEKA